MKTPNSGFVRTLQALDPLLSVRWGNHVNQWVVERVGRIPQDEVFYLGRRAARAWRWANAALDPVKRAEHTKKWAQLQEEYECAQAGKRVIITVPNLDAETYRMLCLGDLRRYGGYARFADMQDAAEEAAIADRERQHSNTNRAVASETYDILNFLWRRKETELLHGERNLGKLLHDNTKRDVSIELTE